MEKLNLGSGKYPLEGWTNVDLRNGDFDVVAPTWPVLNGSVDEILASHLLEHLTRNEAYLFLTKCEHVLKPGGKIHLSVPDMDKFIDCRLKGDYTPLSGYRWIDLNDLLGGNPDADTEFQSQDRHKYMWSWASLAWTLALVGFKNVTRRHWPSDIDNPAYKDISLYVDAVKP